MKCVSYTRTLPWKNHQGELAIAEQNQRIAAYLAEHKELDLLKKYSDRKNDEKARTAFDQMTDDGVERKFDCIIVASMYYCGPDFPAARQAIHHVAIIVSDYEKARDFYVNKLGFAVVRENFRKERNDWKLDLRVGDGVNAIELEIFAEPTPPKRVNRPEACGLRHLAFRVEDVEATVAELAQMGIECEPIRLDSYTKKKMTFFFDPDGLPLELHE